jgi:hypothetical protein
MDPPQGTLDQFPAGSKRLAAVTPLLVFSQARRHKGTGLRVPRPGPLPEHKKSARLKPGRFERLVMASGARERE